MKPIFNKYDINLNEVIRYDAVSELKKNESKQKEMKYKTGMPSVRSRCFICGNSATGINSNICFDCMDEFPVK